MFVFLNTNFLSPILNSMGPRRGSSKMFNRLFFLQQRAGYVQSCPGATPGLKKNQSHGLNIQNLDLTTTSPMQCDIPYTQTHTWPTMGLLHPYVAVTLCYACLGVKKGQAHGAFSTKSSIITAAVLDGLAVKLLTKAGNN